MTSPIKKIIAPLVPGHEAAILGWAERLAGDLGACVDGAHLRQDAQLSTLLFGPGFASYVSEAAVEELRKGARDAEAAARASFEAARDRGRSVHFGRFLSVGDAPEGNIARVARAYDLAVTVLPSKGVTPPYGDLLARLALDAGVPVFAAPEAVAADRRLDKALLAWDGSREAGRAMRAAVPLLKRARSVQIVHLGETVTGYDPVHEAALYLEAHGVTSDAAQLKSLHAPAGEALLALTRTTEADLVVMGAYGHPRWMEQAFGGATHDLLHEADVPILLAH